jgi:type II secretory ATPase GspE/PulE/Tfp pilus assembly ATPase PilB-like protein
MVTDLESRNGTRVNDKKISKTLLKPGDILRIGSHEFLFETEQPSREEMKREQQEAFHVDRAIAPIPVPDRPTQESPVEANLRFGKLATSMHENPDSLLSGGIERSELVGWMFELASTMDNLPPRDVPPETVSVITSTGIPSEALAGSSDGPNCVRMLLQLASKSRATDIHMEPRPEHYLVRMRVDGDMVAIVELPKRVGELAFGLIKTACNMQIQGRDSIQEGHFSSILPDRRVEFRVSFTPSVHGQKLVVRVLDMRTVPASLAELGFANYMVERLRRVCEQDSGLLLVSGPTGSGKTTTLYNCLRLMDRQARNVITIEDPVEYQLEGVTQIPVDEHKGNTFGTMLRSVLRQDPDVIFVGEIRDEETARTAMQAAMTGHVVFSTVHAKDTISSVFRLLDLKVEPYLVANSLDLILAQRLVRVLCDQCKREVRVSPGQATRLGRFLGDKNILYVPTGCARCLRTGYRGRRAIFEMLEFNDDLRDIVLRNPTIAGIRKIIDQGHFMTLTQFGWKLAADGVTSLDEVDKVAASAR